MTAWRNLNGSVKFKFYVLCGAILILWASLHVIIVIIDGAKARRIRFAQEVAEGLRLSSGVQIVRDQQTGCQYLVESTVGVFVSGYTLIPRLGEDGLPMGCGKK